MERECDGMKIKLIIACMMLAVPHGLGSFNQSSGILRDCHPSCWNSSCSMPFA
jgi:hypothetical protein